MKTAFISIGDELLIGQTINTNVSWLGEQISLLGGEVVKSVTIQDKEADIIESLNEFVGKIDLVVITGGLGPTKDDITKKVLAQYFNSELILNQDVLKHVEAFFVSRNRPMLDVNVKQAELPECCEILFNRQGTAMGMWFEDKGSVVISLPGVPYEMKGIMQDFGFDKIKSKFNVRTMTYKTIQLQGIGESFLAERMKDWEIKLREEGLGLAYLPSVGNLKLRISSTDQKKDRIDHFITEIQKTLPQYVYGDDKKNLNEIIGQLLLDNKLTIGTVESCTAGLLANSIVTVSGASAYFSGSMLTYSNELKTALVDVPKEVLNSKGAVSKEVVEFMALNGAKKLGVDVCLSTSGVAGPDGGTPEKPVGFVWIGIAVRGKVSSYSFHFGNDRLRNMQLTVLTALNLLRCNILNIPVEKK